MRNRTEEINVRVYKTEKNTIRRKAKKSGMNMSEYLRSLGTGAAVREAPRRFPSFGDIPTYSCRFSLPFCEWYSSRFYRLAH